MYNLSRFHTERLERICDLFLGASDNALGATNKKRLNTNPMLLNYVLGSLGLTSAKEVYKWEIDDAPESKMPKDCTFRIQAANAVIIWAILHGFPGSWNAQLSNNFFSDKVAGAIELYESEFKTLSPSKYEKIRSRCDWDRSSYIESYPILCENMNKSRYTLARKAYKALSLQEKIVKRDCGRMYDWDLANELLSLDAPNALYVLSGNSVDLRDDWHEDETDYSLAVMLFEALSDFYVDGKKRCDAGEMDKTSAAWKLFHGKSPSITLVEDAAKEMEIGLLLKIFLSGVPTSDILA